MDLISFDQFEKVAVPSIFRLGVATDLIKKNTYQSFLDFWGQNGVNVLKLNMALDVLSENKSKKK